MFVSSQSQQTYTTLLIIIKGVFFVYSFVKLHFEFSAFSFSSSSAFLCLFSFDKKHLFFFRGWQPLLRRQEGKKSNLYAQTCRVWIPMRKIDIHRMKDKRKSLPNSCSINISRTVEERWNHMITLIFVASLSSSSYVVTLASKHTYHWRFLFIYFAPTN